MGGLIKTLENRTALLLAVVSLLLAGVFFALCCLAVSYSDGEASVEASDRLLAIAGRLAQTTDLTDEQIAEAFTAKGTDEAARGAEALSAYGFEAGSGRGAEYLYTRSRLPAIAAAAGIILCGGAGLIALHFVFRGVKQVTGSAEKKEPCTADLSDRDLLLLAEAVNSLERDRRRILTSLSEEKRYLADYLHDLSHQIKTPSAGLMLNNEIYRTHPMERQEMLSYLERDRVCIERINRLCAESLKLARLEAGAVEYHIQEESLSDIVTKACAPLYPLAERNGDVLTYHISEDITVSCDALWFAEAVSNLVKNACEHTQGGSITLTAEQTPMAVKLIITDTGEGIAPEDIPMLFRRFYSKRSDKDPVSVGIGMSISKRITEDMRGRIYIDTELGMGTSVTIELLN